MGPLHSLYMSLSLLTQLSAMSHQVIDDSERLKENGQGNEGSNKDKDIRLPYKLEL